MPARLGPARRDAGQEVDVQPGQAADEDVDEQHDQREQQERRSATRQAP